MVAGRAFAGRTSLVRMTDIFEVLSDSVRRTILELLRTASTTEEPEESVSHLVSATGLSQPTVSKQLKVLRDAGLVTVREEGQHRLYRLNAAPLAVVDEWVSAFGSSATSARSTRATSGKASATARSQRRTNAPDFVLDAARDLGAALADLAGKAPWR